MWNVRGVSNQIHFFLFFEAKKSMIDFLFVDEVIEFILILEKKETIEETEKQRVQQTKNR